ncbi:MAG: hypothetical protein GX654_00325 [Desulfatiglans sp.]|jgi:predicted 3-demethylubiquinone-9 3-methyltransferase (glyoxalase superfamily)|nr:hypothetical protein [Desulfatiglans sp.]
MQRIVPHLWFDKEAREAAEFYGDVFGNGPRVINMTTLHDTPSGDVDVVSFEVWGYRYILRMKKFDLAELESAYNKRE